MRRERCEGWLLIGMGIALFGGACAERTVLGERQSDAGMFAPPEELVPTVRPSHKGLESVALVPQRSLVPRWRHDVGPGYWNEIAVSSTGSIWSAERTTDPDRTTDTITFTELDGEGHVSRAYASLTVDDPERNRYAPVALDADGYPYVLWWRSESRDEEASVALLRAGEDGADAQSLPPQLAPADTVHLQRMQDGTFLRLAAGETAYASRQDDAARELWRAPLQGQFDLRPDGTSPSDSYPRVIFLEDGKIVVDNLVKRNGEYLGDTWGYSVVSAAGQLLWDAHTDSGANMHLIAATPGAGLVLAGVPYIEADLAVQAHDGDAEGARFWSFQRADYHLHMPRALVADEDGTIHVAVGAGALHSPRLLICSIPPDACFLPTCADAGLTSVAEGMHMPWRDLQMDVLQSGSVVLSVEHEADGQQLHSIFRYDLQPYPKPVCDRYKAQTNECWRRCLPTR